MSKYFGLDESGVINELELQGLYRGLFRPRIKPAITPKRPVWRPVVKTNTTLKNATSLSPGYAIRSPGKTADVALEAARTARRSNDMSLKIRPGDMGYRRTNAVLTPIPTDAPQRAQRNQLLFVNASPSLHLFCLHLDLMYIEP
jgi:hypothetical protein